MKLTVFVLIAGLCVVAVTANASRTASFEPIEEYDFEYLAENFAEDYVDIETHGLFSGLYWVFKKALRTLKGLNCTIQAVLNVRTAAQKFIDDVHACGGQVTKQVQKLIDACQDIINTSNDIINLNDNVCNNADYNEESDGDKKTSSSCFWKLLKKLNKLKKQIKHALKLIKKVPTVGTGASDCVTTAANELKTAFTSFPGFVRTCSKLTS